MSHERDDLLQKRQRQRPHPRHLPDAEDFPGLIATPKTPSGDHTPRKSSRLKKMVQVQEDGDLVEMYDDFEEWRTTGKRPEQGQADEILLSKRYLPLNSSSYRPYSLYSTPTRFPANPASISAASVGLESPASGRLGSSELFPDRYQAQNAIAVPYNMPGKTRDSVIDGAGVSCDPTGPQAATSTPAKESANRRNAARSDSEMSSVSSTESNRDRKALAVKLNEAKSRVELANGKSTASIGFTSTAGALLRNIANVFSPSSGKTSAEDVTRQLSKSPTRRRNTVSHDGRLEASLDNEKKGNGSVNSSMKRSRQNSAIGASSRKRQQRSSTDNETPISPQELGILPSPSGPVEALPMPSEKEGTIEGGEEAHNNALQETNHPYPKDSESHKFCP